MNEPIFRYVSNLVAQRFWGFLTLKFEDGKLVHLRREENLKPATIQNLLDKNEKETSNESNQY